LLWGKSVINVLQHLKQLLIYQNGCPQT